jgi:hypothetical protein
MSMSMSMSMSASKSGSLAHSSMSSSVAASGNVMAGDSTSVVEESTQDVEPLVYTTISPWLAPLRTADDLAAAVTKAGTLMGRHVCVCVCVCDARVRCVYVAGCVVSHCPIHTIAVLLCREQAYVWTHAGSSTSAPS